MSSSVQSSGMQSTLTSYRGLATSAQSTLRNGAVKNGSERNGPVVSSKNRNTATPQRFGRKIQEPKVFKLKKDFSKGGNASTVTSAATDTARSNASSKSSAKSFSLNSSTGTSFSDASTIPSPVINLRQLRRCLLFPHEKTTEEVVFAVKTLLEERDLFDSVWASVTAFESLKFCYINRFNYNAQGIGENRAFRETIVEETSIIPDTAVLLLESVIQMLKEETNEMTTTVQDDSPELVIDSTSSKKMSARLLRRKKKNEDSTSGIPKNSKPRFTRSFIQLHEWIPAINSGLNLLITLKQEDKFFEIFWKLPTEMMNTTTFNTALKMTKQSQGGERRHHLAERIYAYMQTMNNTIEPNSFTINTLIACCDPKNMRKYEEQVRRHQSIETTDTVRNIETIKNINIWIDGKLSNYSNSVMGMGSANGGIGETRPFPYSSPDIIDSTDLEFKKRIRSEKDEYQSQDSHHSSISAQMDLVIDTGKGLSKASNTDTGKKSDASTTTNLDPLLLFAELPDFARDAVTYCSLFRALRFSPNLSLIFWNECLKKQGAIPQQVLDANTNASYNQHNRGKHYSTAYATRSVATLPSATCVLASLYHARQPFLGFIYCYARMREVNVSFDKRYVLTLMKTVGRDIDGNFTFQHLIQQLESKNIRENLLIAPDAWIALLSQSSEELTEDEWTKADGVPESQDTPTMEDTSPTIVSSDTAPSDQLNDSIAVVLTRKGSGLVSGLASDSSTSDSSQRKQEEQNSLLIIRKVQIHLVTHIFNMSPKGWRSSPEFVCEMLHILKGLQDETVCKELYRNYLRKRQQLTLKSGENDNSRGGRETSGNVITDQDLWHQKVKTIMMQL